MVEYNKKLISSLSELFYSEKNYIDDLKLWQNGLRKAILEIPDLNFKYKCSFCKCIFINTESIYRMHIKLFDQMARISNILQSDDSYIDEDIDSGSYEITTENKNNLFGIEYASIFLENFENFDLYYEYSAKLAKSAYIFEKSMHFNETLSYTINKYMKTNNMAKLGARNYLYRPINKIARYSLLIKAIIKYEKNNEYINLYKKLYSKFEEHAKKLDEIYKSNAESWQLFTLSNTLYFNNLYSGYFINLISKDTKLLSERKVIVKLSVESPASYKYVFIFNSYILLCKTIETPYQKYEIIEAPIFLNNIIMISKNLDSKWKDEHLSHFYVLQITHQNTVLFYYNDQETRDFIYNLILQAILKSKKYFINDMGICSVNKLSNEIIVCASGSNYYNDVITKYYNNKTFINSDSSKSNELLNFHDKSSSMASMKSTTYNNHLDNLGTSHIFVPNFDEYLEDKIKYKTSSINNEKSDNFMNIISGYDRYISTWKTNIFTNYNISIPRSSDYVDNKFNDFYDNLILFSTDSKICMWYNDSIQLVKNKYANKIIYDQHNKIIFYIHNSRCFVSHFNPIFNNLNERCLDFPINDMFYGKINEKDILVLVFNQEFGLSLIYLFDVQFSNNQIDISFKKTFYVGYKATHISFINNKIVIACQTFKVIDIDSLQTREFIEYQNPVAQLIFNNMEESKKFFAKKVLEIGNGLYLLCYETVGFFVDRFGDICSTDIIFSWECQAIDFKLYKDKIIVLCFTHISVFSLNTGKMINIEHKHDLSFVENTRYPLFYTLSGMLYKLTMYEDYDSEDATRKYNDKLTNNYSYKNSDNTFSNSVIDTESCNSYHNTIDDLTNTIEHIKSPVSILNKNEIGLIASDIDCHSDNNCIMSHSIIKPKKYSRRKSHFKIYFQGKFKYKRNRSFGLARSLNYNANNLINNGDSVLYYHPGRHIEYFITNDKFKNSLILNSLMIDTKNRKKWSSKNMAKHNIIYIGHVESDKINEETMFDNYSVKNASTSCEIDFNNLNKKCEDTNNIVDDIIDDACNSSSDIDSNLAHSIIRKYEDF